MRSVFIVFLLAAAVVAPGQNKAMKETLDAPPYVPTPMIVVDRMLKLGGLKAGEKVFDPGSGDGRIVIMAAKNYKADATGVEFDDALQRKSSAEIKRYKLDGTARIVLGDLFAQDYSSADLVTIYLLPHFNERLETILEKQLKKGTRIVSHDFEFPGWKPVKVELVEDDGQGRSHTLFLYVR